MSLTVTLSVFGTWENSPCLWTGIAITPKMATMIFPTFVATIEVNPKRWWMPLLRIGLL